MEAPVHPGPAPDVDSVRVHRLIRRWPAGRPFLAVGVFGIIAGGLVAAVTRPLDLELGSWLAAFLVLVAGVAQATLGVGQAWLAATPPAPSLVTKQVLALNAGLALTAGGSLAAAPALTTIGAVPTAGAIGSFLVATHEGTEGPRWIRITHRSLAAMVLVSIPIGAVLSWQRHP